MVCLGNICINTLHKGDNDDDGDDDDDDNNNNNNNVLAPHVILGTTNRFTSMTVAAPRYMKRINLSKSTP